MSSWSGSSKSPLLGLQLAASFLQCAHVTFDHCVHVARDCSFPLLRKPPVLSDYDLILMISFNLNYRLKIFFPNTVTMKVRALNLGEDKIQSIAIMYV